MFKVLLLSVLISFGKADVIGHKTCICENYILQSQCPNDCIWDYQMIICTKPNLSTAATAKQCYNVPGVWSPSVENPNIGTCFKYEGCKYIKEYSPEVFKTASNENISQYPLCTYIPGASSCSDYFDSSPCSSLNKDFCYREASDGFCALNADGTACELATNCNEYPAEYCLAELCQVKNEKCVMATCDINRADLRDCTYVFDSLPILGGIAYISITACTITNKNPPQCQIAPGTSVIDTPDLCANKTANTYTWNTNDENLGACIRCYGKNFMKIITISVILMAFL